MPASSIEISHTDNQNLNNGCFTFKRNIHLWSNVMQALCSVSIAKNQHEQMMLCKDLSYW